MKCDVFRGLATVCRRELLFVVHKGMYLTYFIYYIIKWMNVGEKKCHTKNMKLFCITKSKDVSKFPHQRKKWIKSFLVKESKIWRKKKLASNDGKCFG